MKYVIFFPKSNKTFDITKYVVDLFKPKRWRHYNEDKDIDFPQKIIISDDEFIAFTEVRSTGERGFFYSGTRWICYQGIRSNDTIPEWYFYGSPWRLIAPKEALKMYMNFYDLDLTNLLLGPDLVLRRNAEQYLKEEEDVKI